MSTQALTPLAVGFTQEQIDIIKSQVAPKGTTNDELAMFLQYCQRTGLDPFARQIYLSERRAQVNGQWTVTRKPETTIDGFRVIAERAGKYAGQLGPFWCGEDGTWRDVWTLQDAPVAARVGILRHDFLEPLWAVALYDEYVQLKDGKPNSMWNKMPANQLAKCAESLALRRAFPRELSGLYTREELPSEHQEAKDAQADYLKGRLEEIRKPKELPQAVKEFADIDPESPSPTVQSLAKGFANEDKNIVELRHAAKVAEADAILSETAKAPKRKKGGVSFDVLKHFKELKGLLRDVTGDDTAYYTRLRDSGYEHADAIKDDDEARALYKALLLIHKRATEQKELLALLEHSSEVIGQRAFADLLGVHGCETLDQVLQLGGDPLAALLTEMKALVDARKATNV